MNPAIVAAVKNTKNAVAESVSKTCSHINLLLTAPICEYKPRLKTQ